MYQGFLQMAGVEIVNAERTKAYIDNVMPTFPLQNCVECGTLHLALGHLPYTSPIVDDAPWFDPANAATGKFFGLYPLEFEKFEGSTTTGTVVEAIGAGGFVNGLRKATRGMRVRGVLVGEDEDAVSAGLVWLQAALDPAPCSEHGGSCGGSTICYYSACPIIEDCYDESGGFSFQQFTGPITPDSSPLILPRPTSDARLQGTFVIPPTDGTIFEYGQMLGESSKEISHFGPFMSQRTNYVANPSFTEDLRGWQFNSYEPGTTRTVNTNYMTNPNFGAALMDWTPLNGGSATRYTGDFVSSPACMQVGASALGRGAISPTISPATSARADRPVTVSFYFKAPVGALIGSDFILVKAGVNVVDTSAQFTGNGAWQRVQFTGHNPDTDPMRFSVYSAQSGMVFYVDNAMMENSPVASDYFDGNTPADQNFTYEWDGTVNASRSLQVISSSMLIINRNEFANPHFRKTGAAVNVRTNYIPNPNFETDATQWSVSFCTLVSQVSSEAVFGTRRGLMTATSNATGMAINTDPLPVVAGNAYTFSAYKMAVNKSFATNIQILFANSGGVTGTASSTTITTDRERMVVSAIAPPLTTFAIISINVVDPVLIGDQIAFDAVMMEDGSLPGPYFDGSSAPDETFTFAWNGTPNASTSFQKGLVPTNTTTSDIQGKWFQNHFDDGIGASYIIGQGGSAWGASLVVGLVSGAAYTMVTRFRTSWNGNIRLRINQGQGVGGETIYPVLAGQWQTLNYTAVNSGTGPSVGFVGRAGDGFVRGDQLDVQYMAIIDIPDIDHPYTGEYFDGNTPAVDGIFYTWEGTPDNSDSLASGDLLSAVRIPTGGVDDGAYASLFSAYPSVQLSRNAYVPVNGLFGVAQVSLYLRSMDNAQVYFFVQQDGSDSIQQVIQLTPEWTRYSVQVPNGRNSGISLYSDYGGFDIDQVLFEQAHTLLDYFDGDDADGLPMPGAIRSDYTLSWLGEPNLSPSRWSWIGDFYEKSDEPGGGIEHTAQLPWICGTDWRAFISVIVGSFSTSTYIVGGQTRIPDEKQAERFERSYHEVTVTSGPSVIRDYKLANGAAKEIEFFMTAGSPAAYGATKELVQFSPLNDYPLAEYSDTGYTRINLATNPKLAFVGNYWYGFGPSTIQIHGGPTPYIQNYFDSQWGASNLAAISYGVDISGAATPGSVPVTPGQWYSASVWVKASDPISLNAWLVFPGADNSEVTSFTLQIGEWRRIAISGLAPAGATTAGLALVVDDGETQHLYATGVVITEGRFTVLPYFDGGMTDTPAYTYSWTGGADLSTSQVVYVADCPVDPSDAPIVDPSCPQPPPKPTAPVVDNPCLSVPTDWLRYYLEIHPEDVAAWSQTLPTVTINSATQEVRSIRVRFFANPFDRPPEELDPCSYCAEFILSYLPAEAELTVDGTVERAYASVAGAAPQPASNLLYGTGGAPMTWPSLSCGVGYTMTVDVPTTAPDDLTVSLALTSQE